MKELTTVEQVIEALGGTAATARLLGAKMTAVSNWKHVYKRFPPRTFVLINGELKRLGKRAPASLWGMAEPNEAA